MLHDLVGSAGVNSPACWCMFSFFLSFFKVVYFVTAFKKSLGCFQGRSLPVLANHKGNKTVPPPFNFQLLMPSHQRSHFSYLLLLKHFVAYGVFA